MFKTTQEYNDHKSKSNSHYWGNKAAKIEGKGKEVRRAKNPYAKPTVGKSFKCNNPRHKSNGCPLRKAVNIVKRSEKNEEIICEADG